MGKTVDTWRDMGIGKGLSAIRGLRAIRWIFSPGRQYRLTTKQMYKSTEGDEVSVPKVKELVFLRDIGVNHFFRHVGKATVESFTDGQLVDYTIRGM